MLLLISYLIFRDETNIATSIFFARNIRIVFLKDNLSQTVVIMATKKHLTEEVRGAVVAMFESGISASKIADDFKIQRKTVYNLVNKKTKYGSVKNLIKKGRNRCTSVKEDRKIVRMFKKNPSLSPTNISNNVVFRENVGVSHMTIRRRLLEANLRTYVMRKAPSISMKNKKTRLQFAQKYRHETVEFWRQVLFTDESSFAVHGTYGRKFAYMEPKNRKKSPPTLPTQRHGGGSIMFWGCMSINGVGDLVQIDGNVNQAVYIELLNNSAFQSGDKLIGQDFILQQDNAPCHKGRNVTSFLNGSSQQVLEWPPQSPDLNVIEHVWAYLKRHRNFSLQQTREEAIKNVHQLWNDIPMAFLINLVESMPRRLQAVIDAKGGNTKY